MVFAKKDFPPSAILLNLPFFRYRLKRFKDVKYEAVRVGVIGNCLCRHEQVREERKLRAQPCT